MGKVVRSQRLISSIWVNHNRWFNDPVIFLSFLFPNVLQNTIRQLIDDEHIICNYNFTITELFKRLPSIEDLCICYELIKVILSKWYIFKEIINITCLVIGYDLSLWFKTEFYKCFLLH